MRETSVAEHFPCAEIDHGVRTSSEMLVTGHGCGMLLRGANMLRAGHKLSAGHGCGEQTVFDAWLRLRTYHAAVFELCVRCGCGERTACEARLRCANWVRGLAVGRELGARSGCRV